MPSLSDIKKTIICLKVEYETISFYIIDNKIYIIEYDYFYSKHIIHSWDFKTNTVQNVNLNNLFQKYHKIYSYIEYKKHQSSCWLQ